MGNSDSKYRIPSNLFKNEHYTKAEFNQNEILKRSGKIYLKTYFHS